VLLGVNAKLAAWSKSMAAVRRFQALEYRLQYPALYPL
jgi:hypothetical protein